MAVRSILAYTKIVGKPLSKAMPLFIQTLGDHIRKKGILRSKNPQKVTPGLHRGWL